MNDPFARLVRPPRLAALPIPFDSLTGIAFLCMPNPTSIPRRLARVGIGLLVAAIISWGLFTLNPNVSAAIIATAVTAMVSIYQINASRRHQTEALIEKDLREKKVEVYQKLISFIIEMLFADKMGKTKSPQDVLRAYAEFAPSMTIWTSDEVLAEFARFRTGLVEQKDSLDARDVVRHLERLILTIRRDLGHQNVALTEGDIISVFITDAYTVLNAGANKAVQPTRPSGPRG